MENNNGGSFGQNDQNQRNGSEEQNAQGIDQQNMNRIDQQEQQAENEGQGNSESGSSNERWSMGQNSGTNNNPQEQQSGKTSAYRDQAGLNDEDRSDNAPV
jgi:hypothetical protein